MDLPACSKCRTPLPLQALRPGRFAPCPSCGAELWIEVFAALVRPIARGRAGEALVVTGESACFYHENKKAAAICDACGRFLCGLCDCQLSGRHYCLGCIEAGRRKGTIEHLETVRPLYGRQALLLAILPLLVTGLFAIYLAVRHRKTPGSLVSPQRWLMPTALVLGILQTLGFAGLFLMAFLS